MNRSLLLPWLLFACAGNPPATDASGDGPDPDTEAPWTPPPAGRFQFQTTTSWAEGEHWTVDAHYFPASQPERPAVLFVSGSRSWKSDTCGIDDWPPGMVEPFVQRDWAVIVTDRVGCRTTHAWYGDLYEVEKYHRADDLMVQLTRKLRADGYGPLTVLGGESGLYWVRARDFDVPQMKAGVLPGFPRTGTSYPMSESVPFDWLFIPGWPSEERWREYNETTWDYMGAPQDSWTWMWGDIASGGFFSMSEGNSAYPPNPGVWEDIAAWLEPRLEEAYEAGPEGWETP